MRLLIVLLSTLAFTSAIAQNASIYGNWELTKIETKKQVLYPEKVSYSVQISKEVIRFNLEINKCQVNDFVLTDNYFSYKGAGCTKICCDGSTDSISNYINYNGFYKILEDELVITTSDSKLYLKRILD